MVPNTKTATNPKPETAPTASIANERPTTRTGRARRGSCDHGSSRPRTMNASQPNEMAVSAIIRTMPRLALPPMSQSAVGSLVSEASSKFAKIRAATTKPVPPRIHPVASSRLLHVSILVTESAYRVLAIQRRDHSVFNGHRIRVHSVVRTCYQRRTLCRRSEGAGKGRR
jgi:hypothetical protein